MTGFKARVFILPKIHFFPAGIFFFFFFPSFFFFYKDIILKKSLLNSHLKKKLFLFRQKPRCPHCEELIFAGSFVNALDKVWHTQHFR